MAKILIIGPGALGSSLALSLKHFTHHTLQLRGRKPFANADLCPELQTHYTTAAANELASAADLIIIAVPDNAIPRVVEQLAGVNLSGKSVVHTSGFADSALLTPLAQQGAKIGSWHPFQTFNKKCLAPRVWQNILCTYQGDPDIFDTIQALCRTFNSQLIAISSEQKKALHLGAAITSNFVVGLLQWAHNVITRSGLSSKQARQFMLPMLKQVENNFAENDPQAILSGPVKRGDTVTIEGHLKLLASQPRENALYRQLAQWLVDHFTTQNTREILKLLQEHSPN